MRYSKLVWRNHGPEFPDLIYSQIDDDGYEVRKVEVFPDGHYGCSDGIEQRGRTELSDRPMPEHLDPATRDLTLLALDSQEFDRQWRLATGSR
jgi:hypothetical protein